MLGNTYNRSNDYAQVVHLGLFTNVLLFYTNSLICGFRNKQFTNSFEVFQSYEFKCGWNPFRVVIPLHSVIYTLKTNVLTLIQTSPLRFHNYTGIIQRNIM